MEKIYSIVVAEKIHSVIRDFQKETAKTNIWLGRLVGVLSGFAHALTAIVYPLACVVERVILAALNVIYDGKYPGYSTDLACEHLKCGLYEGTIGGIKHAFVGVIFGIFWSLNSLIDPIKAATPQN